MRESVDVSLIGKIAMTTSKIKIREVNKRDS